MRCLCNIIRRVIWIANTYFAPIMWTSTLVGQFIEVTSLGVDCYAYSFEIETCAVEFQKFQQYYPQVFFCLDMACRDLWMMLEETYHETDQPLARCVGICTME